MLITPPRPRLRNVGSWHVAQVPLAEPGVLRMVAVGSSTPVVVAVGSTPINILRRALCRRWQQHPCCCRRWQQSPNNILWSALNSRRREQHPSCCRRWQHHNCESKNFVEGTVSPSLHSYKLDHWSRWRWRWRMPKLEPHTVNIPCASKHTAPTRPFWLYHCGIGCRRPW